MKKKYTLGVGLNLFDARAVLLKDGNLCVATFERKRKEITANDTIKVILELCEGIMNRAKKFKGDICGIGLALGGIVDKKKGVVYWPQRVDSTYVYVSIPLKKYLENRFKLPVVIENDANASLWAEYVRNFPKYKNIVYLFSGVGCGLLLDGSLYRGKKGAAGELFINTKRRMSSYLGEFSFLGQWSLDLGIVKRAKELISLGRTTSLIKKISSLGDLCLEDIFSEARNKKDRVSWEILKEAAFSLGVKLSFLVDLLNPELAIIGGGFEEAGEFFLEEITRTVKKFSLSEMREGLKIVFSKLGREATSLGAALLVYEENSLQ